MIIGFVCCTNNFLWSATATSSYFYFREIQNTQFFKGLNWEALYKREVEPPFKPQLESDLDTSYFDPDFTNETVQLTPTSDVRSQQLETVEEMDENGEFIQFSFNRIGSGPLVSTQFWGCELLIASILHKQLSEHPF